MNVEKECTLLGNLFHHIVTDLKSSAPAWDDFVNKGSKLHNLLKSTTLALGAFTESIQKIADMATNTKGSTKDVGSALTRICVRQKMVENKLKHFTNALMDSLIFPVQDRLEEWKKTATQLEKDHSKDYKRATQEIKKRNSDTLRLQKKARKGSKPDLHQQLNSVVHDVNERFASLEETEKSALRNLLVEERSRICLFANCLSPVLNLEISILNEASHLHDLCEDMSRLCRNPKQLPTSTDQLVQDYIAANGVQSPSVQDLQANVFLEISNAMSPPSTPTDGSRKSSVCSLNSLTSSDSLSSGSLNRASSVRQRPYQQGHHRRTNSGTPFNNGLGSPTSCKSAPAAGGPRLSVSSHDSGFISTGNGNGAGLQPSFSDVIARLPGQHSSEKADSNVEDAVDGACPVIRGRSLSQQMQGALSPLNTSNRFSWKDWDKPGPYDLKLSIPNKSNKCARDVLSRKSGQPPPIISPKPPSIFQRSSVDDSAPRKTPLHRTHTAPSCNLSVMQKDDSLPPPPNGDMPFTPSADDTLPLPPPSFLEDLPPPPPSATLGTLSNPQTNSSPDSDFPVMTLNRKSSLQYSTSSGYSSQYSTPACSEDTINSYDTGYSSIDYCNANRKHEDTYSTLPKNYHRSNEADLAPRGTFSKRSASTNGLPSANAVTNDIQSGTATIRRKPSGKSIRRTSVVPKPVVPPTVPTTGPVFSTFSTPLSFANNNNNNSEKKESVPPTARKQSLPQDLTLRFQQCNPDFYGDSPTPTTTPIVGDFIQPCNSVYAPPSKGTVLEN